MSESNNPGMIYAPGEIQYRGGSLRNLETIVGYTRLALELLGNLRELYNMIRPRRDIRDSRILDREPQRTEYVPQVHQTLQMAYQTLQEAYQKLQRQVEELTTLVTTLLFVVQRNGTQNSAAAVATAVTIILGLGLLTIFGKPTSFVSKPTTTLIAIPILLLIGILLFLLLKLRKN